MEGQRDLEICGKSRVIREEFSLVDGKKGDGSVSSALVGVPVGRHGSELRAYWERFRAMSPEEQAVIREQGRTNGGRNWEQKKERGAYYCLRRVWQTYVDILPSCRWDYNLALKKTGGLGKAAYKNFGHYLSEHPILERAIQDLKGKLCPQSLGSVTDADMEESERLHRKIMMGIETIADYGESEATRLKALETLARTQGMFQDKSEIQMQFAGFAPDVGSAERARERQMKEVVSVVSIESSEVKELDGETEGVV